MSLEGETEVVRWLRAVGRGVADFIVPPMCLGCQRALESHDCLCANCWRQVRFIRPPICDRLGLPLPYDTGGTMISGAAAASPPDWDRARAVAHFDPLIRQLLHAFKYGDRHDATRLFARWLAEAGRDVLAQADLLVPVPLHRLRLLRRKYNQSALLAQALARRTGIAYEPSALRRVKPTRAQVGLTHAARMRNVSGAFRCPPTAQGRLSGSRVLLVDDVITTGATAAACARALKRCGVSRVDVLALAMVTEASRIGT